MATGPEEQERTANKGWKKPPLSPLEEKIESLSNNMLGTISNPEVYKLLTESNENPFLIIKEDALSHILDYSRDYKDPVGYHEGIEPLWVHRILVSKLASFVSKMNGWRFGKRDLDWKGGKTDTLSCPNCGNPLLRVGDTHTHNKPKHYYYCLHCMKSYCKGGNPIERCPKSQFPKPETNEIDIKELFLGQIIE